MARQNGPIGFLLLLILVVGPRAFADEGMWTLDNLPKAEIAAATGAKIDQAWIEKIQLSSVRLANGCSGSFVSSKGLVMTNHHCVRDCIYKVSTQHKNYLKNGFLARDPSEEKVCPAFEINRLVEIQDVTKSVQDRLRGLEGEAFSAAKKKLTADLEKSCVKDVERERCDLVDLYRGGQFHLYRYHRYPDVRLHFAPEAAMGHFGGDPDNFNFPRYSFDVAFLRVYENGKPLENPHFFSWSKTPTFAGEASFITGHPGSTQRLLTVAQMMDLRDHSLPNMISLFSEFRGQLHQFVKRGAEFERIAQARIGRIENGLKAYKGRVQSLRDPNFFGQIQKKETEFRQQIQRSFWKKRKYGDPWADMAAATARLREKANEIAFVGYGVLDPALMTNYTVFESELLAHARHLVRYHVEMQKPNGERLREYTEAKLPQLKQVLLSEAPIYDELEILSLEFFLTKMREILSPDHAFVKKVLGNQSPAQLAQQLVKRTRLKSKVERERLFNGGLEMVRRNQDPILNLIRTIDEDSRLLRKLYEEDLEPAINQAAQKIAQAKFEVFGNQIYPDATFSLRVSYGKVQGWQEGSVSIDPLTRVRGLYQRATGSDPFALPSSWLKAEKSLNPETAFNFVSTNDIIGGNSGSPVLSQNAEVIGLVFDGNIHSLGGAYAFDANLNRAVSVDAGLIRESLDKVYGAKSLVEELGR